MEKKIMAAAAVVATAAVVMFAFGGCADNSVGGNEALSDVGASDSVGVVVANDETEETTENVTVEVTESVTEAVTESVTDEAAVETEELKSVSASFARKSEDESLTIVIDSEIYPYDCEAIEIDVDFDTSHNLGVEAYRYIDLGNLKNYPNLKKLRLNGSIFGYTVELINGDSAAELQNLEEITLCCVAWNEDWLSGIGSLKKLTIGECFDYKGEFLENLKQVETLDIFRCGITELSFINGMSSLTELSVEQSKLNNSMFDGVEENYSVKRLTMSGNDDYIYLDNGKCEYTLTDITGVIRLKGLEYLYINEEDLVDVEQQRQEVQASLPECEVKIYG